MYEGIYDVQQFADKVKSVVLDIRAPKSRRLEVLRSITDLERCRGWHRGMMTDAVQPEIGQSDDGWAFLEGDAPDVLAAIERVIMRYLTMAGCHEDDIMAQIYDMKEAAVYLGIAPDTMKKYVMRQHRLVGHRKNGVILFTRQQLDAFKRELEGA